MLIKGKKDMNIKINAKLLVSAYKQARKLAQFSNTRRIGSRRSAHKQLVFGSHAHKIVSVSVIQTLS